MKTLIFVFIGILFLSNKGSNPITDLLNNITGSGSGSGSGSGNNSGTYKPPMVIKRIGTGDIDPPPCGGLLNPCPPIGGLGGTKSEYYLIER